LWGRDKFLKEHMDGEETVPRVIQALFDSGVHNKRHQTQFNGQAVIGAGM
jgi:hypothetical protein